MKIYTKTGDSGETSLVGGTRVSKASARVCAYGDMDELISCIGVLRCCTDAAPFLRRIQKALMTASAHVASESDNPRLTPFPPEETDALEQEIDRMSAQIPPMTSFVLPSAPLSAAHCHVARCVCRRCERACVALNDCRDVIVAVIRYLNRLSDYLFTLARAECHRHGVAEDFWTD
ncbi:MAG TPA: cob(I)yrinic acid a,c-diamide adenosyltransferase [Candidatus Coprenecus pullistercoris]|nr:cob(I)yrinic acid a,c-diamide adenosyltransferase [Candidatus Coprenecus pullistercoris]